MPRGIAMWNFRKQNVAVRNSAVASAVAIALLLAAQPLQAQWVTATVGAGSFPDQVSVNPATNLIYVTNCGSSCGGSGSGSVTVINGATNATTTLNAGTGPAGVAVNPATNTAYVTNLGSNTVSAINGTSVAATISVAAYPGSVAVNPVTNMIYVESCGSPCGSVSGTVSVINGTTNTVTATVAVGKQPGFLFLNPVTNTIYVTNALSNNVTVIDGATNTTTTVGTGVFPDDVAVNPVTNMIYVTNCGAYCTSFTTGPGTVTVINGATNASIATISVGSNPDAVAVNPVTNMIYIATNTATT